MRKSCLACVIKHITQAMVLLSESTDYPKHRYYAIGHIAEAEDESRAIYPTIAIDLREARHLSSASMCWSALDVILDSVLEVKDNESKSDEIKFAKSPAVIGPDFS